MFVRVLGKVTKDKEVHAANVALYKTVCFIEDKSTDTKEGQL